MGMITKLLADKKCLGALALAMLAMIAAPAWGDASVGLKFSIGSGWSGFGGASDGTNYLVGLQSDKTLARVGAQLISPGGARIGSVIALGHSGQACCSSGVAFDGSNYFVTWEEDQGIKDSSEPFMVYGQFVDTAGNALGHATAITTAGIMNEGINTVAYGGGKYLVTYTRLVVPSMGGGTPTNTYVAARLVSPDGSMGSEFRVSQGFGGTGSVAFDGTNFFVIWKAATPTAEIRGRFISPSGTLGTELSISTNEDQDTGPISAACDGSNCLVMWTYDNGTDAHILARRVSPAGTLVGQEIAVAATPGRRMSMTVAFDGSNYLVAYVDQNNDANGNGVCDAGEGSCWDMYGQHIGKDGALVGDRFIINADAKNQFGGAACGGAACLAVVGDDIVIHSGFRQVGEIYGAWLTLQNPATTLNLVSGWNLLGNSVAVPLDVATTFGNSNLVSTAWKWNAATQRWAFYTPSQADGGASYAASKGYDVLATVNGGEGFWINAMQAFSAQLPAGTAISSASFTGLPSGWSLLSTGDNKTPTEFSRAIGAASATPGSIPLPLTVWAWDTSAAKWYFYSTSMEASGNTVISDYCSSRGHLDFTASARTLQSGTGFWVKLP